MGGGSKQKKEVNGVSQEALKTLSQGKARSRTQKGRLPLVQGRSGSGRDQLCQGVLSPDIPLLVLSLPCSVISASEVLQRWGGWAPVQKPFHLLLVRLLLVDSNFISSVGNTRGSQKIGGYIVRGMSWSFRVEGSRGCTGDRSY